ncbi:MAG: hypothetical protein ABIQ93_02865 [Saprospiraceae bacterium]
MKFLFAFTFFLLLLPACKKATADKPLSCVEQFIADHQLVPYNGQDLGCKFYTLLFELDGQQYFGLGAACIDMLTIPVDCSGNAYCTSIDAPELSYFYRNAAFIGIIGVQP